MSYRALRLLAFFAGAITFFLVGESPRPSDRWILSFMVAVVVAVAVEWCIGLTVASPHTLVSAPRKGRLARVRKILDAGVDVNAQVDGGTALIAAVLGFSSGQLDVLRLLLERGADPSRQYAGGVTALMCASGQANSLVCKILLDHGADHFARNSSGQTALMIASSKGFAETVKVLIVAGADVTLKDPRDLTAAEFATANGHEEVTRLLSAAADK